MVDRIRTGFVPEYAAYGGVPEAEAYGSVSNIPDSFSSNPNYISDEDLLSRMQGNVRKYEGIIQHPYIDTKGNITTGYGANINNKEDFMKVNFTIDGRPATDAEKEMYYEHLQKMSNEVDENNNYKYRNMKARSFENNTPLRISEDDALTMAQNHMRNDLAHVRNQFTEFDSFPQQLKEILLDIQYNTGNLTKENWPHLYGAIERRDVFGDDGIVANVNRRDITSERNDWAENTARLIRF